MKRLKYALLASSLTTCCLYIAPATAADIRLSGFLNAISSSHDAKDMQYIKSIDDKPGFSNTNLGINFASKIDENITLGAQLFATTSDSVSVDWAFAKYTFDDSSAIKFGKIKYAGNLYAETLDVGLLYPWVRAPESIYSESSGLSLESYEGAAYKYTGGDDTEFAIEAYYGATGEEQDENTISARNNMYGLVMTAENEIGKVLLSYNSSVHSSINTTGVPTPNPVDGKTVTLITLGAEANFDSLQLIAEVSQGEHEDLPTKDKLGWFMTAAYSFGKWKPHLTFQDFSIDDKSQEQSSITLGLNRQLSSSAVLKFEVQQISDIIGNGFFEDPIFDAAEIEDGDDVTLYNIALNIVF